MITERAVAFLRELRENNSKQWFDENRKRYEKGVRDAFKALCAEIARRLREGVVELPGLSAEQIASIPPDPKDAIMRINRDLRFSKDKAPYHTYLRAAFVPNGRKSGNAGLYLTIEPDLAGAGGGVYRAVRTYESGLPGLAAVALGADYRTRLDEVCRNGLKKNEALVAIIEISPEEFAALEDQAGCVIDRFAEVSPLIGALQ